MISLQTRTESQTTLIGHRAHYVVCESHCLRPYVVNRYRELGGVWRGARAAVWRVLEVLKDDVSLSCLFCSSLWPGWGTQQQLSRYTAPISARSTDTQRHGEWVCWFSSHSFVTVCFLTLIQGKCYCFARHPCDQAFARARALNEQEQLSHTEGQHMCSIVVHYLLSQCVRCNMQAWRRLSHNHFSP